MFNSKRAMMEALGLAKDIINSVNKEKETEKGYMSYLTPYGWIYGKQYEIIPIDSSSEEKLAEELKRIAKEGKSVDAFSLAQSTFSHWVTNYEKDHNMKVNNSSQAIFLEDVTLKFNDGNVVNSNVFLLFSDQVIGVLPAKI